jgi:hypothetical protein
VEAVAASAIEAVSPNGHAEVMSADRPVTGPAMQAFHESTIAFQIQISAPRTRSGRRDTASIKSHKSPAIRLPIEAIASLPEEDIV